MTAFKTINYVYGKATNEMSDAELIDAIRKVEAEIEDLGKIKTESKKIAEKTKQLQEQLKNIIAELDGR